MEKLVRFRMLSSALSVSEYGDVLCNVLNDNNLEEFSSIIFHYFYQKLKKENATDTQCPLAIEQINQEITTVISQRELKQASESGFSDDDESTVSQPLKVAHFPGTIIQEIASFLTFKSYSNFQCCSRSIFYAANNPCSLYELDVGSTFEKCIKTIDERQIVLFMKRFERIRKLTVFGGKFKYFSLITFRNLKHLELRTSDSEMKQYRSQNVFNFDSITNLSIRLSHESIEIIKLCKNLRYLKLYRHHINYNSTITIEQIDYHQLSRQLDDLECFSNESNLKHLYLSWNALIDMRVLKNITNTLESLFIFCPHHDNLSTGITFNNLTELTLQAPTGQDIISIIKTTKQLKRLKLELSLFDSNSDYGNVALIGDHKLAMKRIFESNTLQYLYIEHGDIRCAQIIQWIEVSFHKKRRTLTLELDMYDVRSHEIHIFMVRLWNTLYAWHTGHVTLVVGVSTRSYTKDLDLWLGDISQGFFVENLITNWQMRILISTNFSVFDGYRVLH